MRIFGTGSYRAPPNVGRILNFYQQNPTKWGTNPFLGGVVKRCDTCATEPNINLTGQKVVHTNMVRYVWRNYESQIRDVLYK